MKNGTPGFIGERLRQARDARSLSATALAEVTGVTKAAISQYESGAQSPRPEVMQRIEQVLNLPAQFFLRPLPVKSRSTIFYRSQAAATKTQRTRAGTRHQWWKEIVEYLRGFVKFPKPDVPKFDLPTNLSGLAPEHIEILAQRTREFWQLGEAPIGNCCWLLENKGIIATRDRLGADTLDSFSEWDELSDTPYVFLGSEKASAVRGRLSAAHELGHIILHSRAHVAGEIEIDHHTREEQANYFAGAFLLPPRAFARDMRAPTLGSFYHLKPKWKVAIGAMIKRAENLGFVSESEVRRMWISIARKGWRTHEPFDDQLEIEEPKVCKNAVELLINERVLTKSELLEQGFAGQDDVEALLCLSKGYLTYSADPARAAVVQLKNRQRVVGTASGIPGKVVPFRSSND